MDNAPIWRAEGSIRTPGVFHSETFTQLRGR
jgi:hypothetical protein